jgi:hypothetical protein
LESVYSEFEDMVGDDEECQEEEIEEKFVSKEKFY